MAPKPWYHKGLRFQCTACGRCCTNHGDHAWVYVSRRDVARLAALLGESEADLRRRWCRPQDGWTVLATRGDACVFLTEEGRCSVYAARPKQCATWPFWQENLERETWEGPVREICPGVGGGPLHAAAEVERIARETEDWYVAPDGSPR